jgi:hypothetical protein
MAPLCPTARALSLTHWSGTNRLFVFLEPLYRFKTDVDTVTCGLGRVRKSMLPSRNHIAGIQRPRARNG